MSLFLISVHKLKASSQSNSSFSLTLPSNLQLVVPHSSVSFFSQKTEYRELEKKTRASNKLEKNDNLSIFFLSRLFLQGLFRWRTVPAI